MLGAEMAADSTSAMGMGMGLYHYQGSQGLHTQHHHHHHHHHQHQHMLSFQQSSSNHPDSTLPPNAMLIPKYKFVTGSPADWNTHELAILKEGLLRYAHEPNIIKYINIAAMLPTRTIRDVALRCCFSTSGKETRRKPGEFYTGKLTRDLKEKMAVSTPVANFQVPLPNNVVPFSFSAHHPGQNSMVSNQVPVLDSATHHLLEENNQFLNQIAENIEFFKMEENMNLFLRTNNNIRTILNRMSETPGIMSQMPPLPVPVNEGNLNSLLQMDRFVGAYGNSHMKE